MYSKSQVAFLMSVEKLFNESDKVYFWTFTFKEIYPDWWYPNIWRRFMQELIKRFPFMPGLRVIEPHKRHGLHFHCLIGARLSVDVVRRVAKKYGIGWLWVKKASPGSSKYLAKYLNKESSLYTGMRHWGTMGGFKQVKTANVLVDSIFHRSFRRLFDRRQMDIRLTTELYRHTILWGEICNLPTSAVVRLEQMRDKFEGRRLRYFDKKRGEFLCPFVAPSFYIKRPARPILDLTEPDPF